MELRNKAAANAAGASGLSPNHSGQGNNNAKSADIGQPMHNGGGSSEEQQQQHLAKPVNMNDFYEYYEGHKEN